MEMILGDEARAELGPALAAGSDNALRCPGGAGGWCGLSNAELQGMEPGEGRAALPG